MAASVAINKSYWPIYVETQHQVPDNLEANLANLCHFQSPATVINLGRGKKPAALMAW